MSDAAPRAGKSIDPEECDDGNKADGDGCSSKCKVERGFICLYGNRFGKDTCFDVNQTWGYRREDQLQNSSSPWSDPFAGMPDVVGDGPAISSLSDVVPGINPPGVRTGSRHLLQGLSGGSIRVNLKIEYVKENADLGNKTMKGSHLLSALKHPDFLRRFQEQMRERDTPVVVSWSRWVFCLASFHRGLSAAVHVKLGLLTSLTAHTTCASSDGM